MDSGQTVCEVANEVNGWGVTDGAAQAFETVETDCGHGHCPTALRLPQRGHLSLKVVSVRQPCFGIDQSETGRLSRTGGCRKQSPTRSPDSDRCGAVQHPRGDDRKPDLQRAAILITKTGARWKARIAGAIEAANASLDSPLTIAPLRIAPDHRSAAQSSPQTPALSLRGSRMTRR
jgi:hypothetical protein